MLHAAAFTKLASECVLLNTTAAREKSEETCTETTEWKSLCPVVVLFNRQLVQTSEKRKIGFSSSEAKCTSLFRAKQVGEY